MRKGQLSSSSTISLVLVSDELVVGEGGEGEIVGGQADNGRAAVLGQGPENKMRDEQADSSVAHASV